MSTVRDLVTAARVSLRGRRSSAVQKYDEFVQAAVSGKEIDPDKFAAFMAEHSFDLDDFMLEAELIEQRRGWLQRAADGPRLEAEAQKIRAQVVVLEKTFAERRAKINGEPPGPARAGRLAALDVEAAAALDATRRAALNADFGAADPRAAAGRVGELDRAIEKMRQKRGAGVPQEARAALAATGRELFDQQVAVREAERKVNELKFRIAGSELSPGDAKKLAAELALAERRANDLRARAAPLEAAYRDAESAARPMVLQ